MQRATTMQIQSRWAPYMRMGETATFHVGFQKYYSRHLYGLKKNRRKVEINLKRQSKIFPNKLAVDRHGLTAAAEITAWRLVVSLEWHMSQTARG